MIINCNKNINEYVNENDIKNKNETTNINTSEFTKNVLLNIFRALSTISPVLFTTFLENDFKRETRISEINFGVKFNK